MIKNIGLITPGGDASGINSCLRAVVREAFHHKLKVFGIYDGYQGLFDNNIKPLDIASVSGIIHQGGTILKSTRCAEIRTPKGLERAAKRLKEHRIDSLIVIGGDGSFRSALKLAQKGIPVIGIPASIDNDIYGTEETIGFDTAMNVAVSAIDRIRDTAASFNRIFLVEVMGRDNGFLALSVGLASGAEYILLPEIKTDLKELCSDLKKAKMKGKKSEIIIFAEGTGDVRKIARTIERQTGTPVRTSSLGYIQRGGAPSGRSRILGTLFGV
ncbi:MAG: 6-phosphofructokinase, partial [Parachlamydiales bacterium]